MLIRFWLNNLKSESTLFFDTSVCFAYKCGYLGPFAIILGPWNSFVLASLILLNGRSMHFGNQKQGNYERSYYGFRSHGVVLFLWKWMLQYTIEISFTVHQIWHVGNESITSYHLLHFAFLHLRYIKNVKI